MATVAARSAVRFSVGLRSAAGDVTLGATAAKGGGLKWLLIAIAVLWVIGVTIGGTLMFTPGGGGGGGTTSTSGAASDIASANDAGPVAIVAKPTCQAFNGIKNSLADIQKQGWADQRSTLGPISEWTAEQRSQVESIATAMRNATDQMVPLANRRRIAWYVNSTSSS
jgi:hypothetical protein